MCPILGLHASEPQPYHVRDRQHPRRHRRDSMSSDNRTCELIVDPLCSQIVACRAVRRLVNMTTEGCEMFTYVTPLGITPSIANVTHVV